MNETSQYKINTAQVVHEIIDGEAVIIHLEKGLYYSLQHAGAALWAMLEQDATVKQIISEINRCYDGHADDITLGVESVLADLAEEHLILPSQGGPSPNPSEPPVAEPEDRPPFKAPKLIKYSDMQDLLLLDPIHEVDPEKGWPHSQAGSGK